MQTIYPIIITGINVAVYLTLFIIVLMHWKNTRSYVAFFFTLFFGFSWVFLSLLEMIEAIPFNIHKVICYIDFIIAPFVCLFFVLFSFHFPRKNQNIKLIHEILLSIPPLIASLLALSGTLVKMVGFNKAIYNEKIYFIYFIIIFIYFVILAPVNLFKKIKKVNAIEKIQIKYILLGYLIAAIFALLGSVLNVLAGGLQNIIYSTIISMTVFFAIVSTYAIVRYRLMDIKVVIRKGVIYSISLIIALTFYTYLALLLKTTIEQYWNISAGWTAFILVALVALGFPPLKSLVERSINTLFKGKKSIDLAVKEVQEKMAVKTDTDALIDLIVQEIRKYLELKEVKLFLIDHQKQKFIYNSEESRQEIELDSELVRYFDKYSDILVREEIQHLAEIRNGRFDKEILQKMEKQMKKEKAGLIIPFKTEEEVFCLILIGDRQDNQAYTVQDIEFLVKLREQVSFTLANALLYKEALARIQAEATSNNY